VVGLGWHVVDLRYLLYHSEAPDAYYAVVERGPEGGWVVDALDAAADVLRPSYATLDEAKAAAIRAVDPEAAPPQVRIDIGKAYEVLQPGRREAAEEFAAGLRAAGLDVQLNVTEYVPGRRGLGPIEMTAIFIGTTVATTLITSVTQDCYQRAKDMLRRRRKHAIESGVGRKRLGFTIYGPRGEVLREWTTDEDQDDGEGRPGSTP